MDCFDIAIIGGGASGFMAGIAAKYCDRKLNVIILEKSDRVLKKLNVTGNGQGNFSNEYINTDNYFGNSFCKFAIDSFNNKKTVEFFANLGIEPVTMENGRIYPKSLQASALSDALRLKAQNLDIQLICNFDAANIEHFSGGFLIDKKIHAKKVIVCTGGAAAPQFNTDGSSYELLTKLNHKLITPYPSLVQIKTDNTITKTLKGIKVNAKLSVISKDFIKWQKDEVLFCDYGLSGKAVFELSPYISRLLKDKKDIKLSLDFFDDLKTEQLCNLLTERKERLSYKNIQDYFTGLINKQAGKAILKLSGILDLSMQVKDLDYKAIESLAKNLKDMQFKATDTLGFKYAQTTIGGISCDDFDDKTMMSKIIPNLFNAGEAIDIDGQCGGYNLQWAWSSGHLAGVCAAKA